MKLSIVIPAFNEEDTVGVCAVTLSGILREIDMDYECIFVDDGSKDSTWEKIQELSEQDEHIKGVLFSRNFGKESAIYAGLAHSQGDCTVVMDCDLQHPPTLIPEMVKLWKEGYEVVEGVKNSRGKETAGHAMAAKAFYHSMSKSMGVDMSRASDFKLLDRKVVEAILNMKEQNAFFRALSAWVGFKTTSIAYDVEERVAGSSKWSTKGLIRYALLNLSAFTLTPLYVVAWLGILMFIVTVVFGIISLVQKIMGVALGGFTTVILLELFIGSVCMISLGIIGYYIAQIHREIKGRPRFIVSERCGRGI